MNHRMEADRAVALLPARPGRPAHAGADPWAPPIGAPVRADRVPLPRRTSWWRALAKHPRLMHYNRLIVGVLLANVAVLAVGVRAGWWSADGSALTTIASVAQANFVLAMLPRQQWLVNLVCWLATRPSTTWPLRVRWTLGKYYHLGGLHVGAATAGTFWYSLFVGSLLTDALRGVGHVSPVNLVLSTVILLLFAAIVELALPANRAKAHDRFEASHRFLAWTALAFVWANTTVFLATSHPDRSLASALLGSPTFWMVALTTLGALWPWLLLRRVPITVERPSSHVALVRLDYGVTPPIGTTRAISRHPLFGWHQFANIPAPAGESGYRMAVSRAGDWTAAFVDEPPTHVWVRGLPTVGVANVKRLFRNVVFVVTGSGIGPALGHLLTSGPDCGLVWITRDPRRTYGDGLVDEVLAARPDAVIWNTDEHGKPDVLRLAYRAYRDRNAEAVICISNKTVTWQVVHGFEQRGIPAFGPIWDS